MKRLKILVSCHKADKMIRNDETYMPIQVGKSLNRNLDLGFVSDDTGDNISAKNASYCELTALYWAWKNFHDYDRIGLAHYRRYMELSEDKANEFLVTHDIILPELFHCRYDNFTNLALLLTHEDAIIAIDTLLSMYPDSRDAVRKYFYQSNKYSVFNMFICGKDTFNEYCEFLFPYLERVESKIRQSGYSRLNRSIGYIAEALMGFWTIYAGKKVKYVPVTDGSTGNYRHGVRTTLRNIQRDLGFRLLYLPGHQDIYHYSAAANALRNDGIELSMLK